MTSAVNGLPETVLQRSDFPWRKGAQARQTEKNVVGLCLTQFRQQNPYRRVRPIGDEKWPLADDFGTLSIRTFLVVPGVDMLSHLFSSIVVALFVTYVVQLT
jgi:hypothetical protein